MELENSGNLFFYLLYIIRYINSTHRYLWRLLENEMQLENSSDINHYICVYNLLHQQHPMIFLYSVCFLIPNTQFGNCTSCDRLPIALRGVGEHIERRRPRLSQTWTLDVKSIPDKLVWKWTFDHPYSKMGSARSRFEEPHWPGPGHDSLLLGQLAMTACCLDSSVTHLTKLKLRSEASGGMLHFARYSK